LHSLAELSGKEQFTSRYIFNLMLKFKPDMVLTNLAGFGLVFGFKGNESGKIIGFRSDLDALPISEENEFFYKSKNPNVSHKCGHDGHSTILIGLAEKLSKRNFPGYVYFIFQPSEENGEGAGKILSDNKFKEIKFDYIFSIHNIPGFDESLVLLKDGVFSGASIGLKIKLMGVQSHASEPMKGISPSAGVAELIWFIEKELIQDSATKNSFANVVFVNLGVKGFGILPGYAEIWVTVRAVRTKERDDLVKNIECKVNELAEKYKFQFKIDNSDNFSSTINDSDAVAIVRKSAEELNLNFQDLNEPFLWSEDFGRFTERFKGALIGLGSGKNCFPLHNPKYDYPDEITKTGINLFKKIIFLANS